MPKLQQTLSGLHMSYGEVSHCMSQRRNTVIIVYVDLSMSLSEARFACLNCSFLMPGDSLTGIS